MPMSEGGGLVTAGNVPNPGEVDRSAAGLQYQSFEMGLKAKGAALGMGRRVATDPNSQFSHPLSDSQFRGGSNARASVEEAV